MILELHTLLGCKWKWNLQQFTACGNKGKKHNLLLSVSAMLLPPLTVIKIIREQSSEWLKQEITQWVQASTYAPPGECGVNGDRWKISGSPDHPQNTIDFPRNNACSSKYFKNIHKLLSNSADKYTHIYTNNIYTAFRVHNTVTNCQMKYQKHERAGFAVVEHFKFRTNKSTAHWT